MVTAQEAAQAEDGMGQKKVINLLPLNVSSTGNLWDVIFHG